MTPIGGVEIISPPISVSRQWQREIRTVFAAVGAQFDLWTHPRTSSHVHVSPGLDTRARYTNRQLVGVAKGALFWEQALTRLLPHDRRDNGYAKPNHRVFATAEYEAVGRQGWGPVFKKVDDLMDQYASRHDPVRTQKFCFCVKFAGGDIYAENKKKRSERYLSTNLLPFTHQGSVELRRQGGVASAESAIHRVLLALTLHVSARCYHFADHANRLTHPSDEDLIRELSRCIRMLPPETCHGSRFIHWLRTCRALHSGVAVSEAKINALEQQLHNNMPSRGGVPSRPQPQPRPQPPQLQPLRQTQPLRQPAAGNPSRRPAPVSSGGGSGGGPRRNADDGSNWSPEDRERESRSLAEERRAAEMRIETLKNRIADRDARDAQGASLQPQPQPQPPQPHPRPLPAAGDASRPPYYGGGSGGGLRRDSDDGLDRSRENRQTDLESLEMRIEALRNRRADQRAREAVLLGSAVGPSLPIRRRRPSVRLGDDLDPPPPRFFGDSGSQTSYEDDLYRRRQRDSPGYYRRDS